MPAWDWGDGNPLGLKGGPMVLGAEVMDKLWLQGTLLLCGLASHPA